MAVAKKLVLESSGTETSIPASSSAGVAVAIGEPAAVDRSEELHGGARRGGALDLRLVVVGRGEAGAVAVSSGACGREVSTSKSRVAVAWLPAASVERTRKVWGPSESGLRGVGAAPVQGPKPGAGVDPALKAAPASPAEKSKVGVASLVRPEGPESIPCAGGVVSTVQLRMAGVASAMLGGVEGADLEGVGAVGQPALWESPGAAQAAKEPASTRH